MPQVQALDFVAAGSGSLNRAAVAVAFDFVAASFSWAPLTLILILMWPSERRTLVRH
jgi:hypothetical protein